METEPFKDVFPIRNGHIPACYVMLVYQRVIHVNSEIIGRFPPHILEKNWVCYIFRFGWFQTSPKSGLKMIGLFPSVFCDDLFMGHDHVKSSKKTNTNS